MLVSNKSVLLHFLVQFTQVYILLFTTIQYRHSIGIISRENKQPQSRFKFYLLLCYEISGVEWGIMN